MIVSDLTPYSSQSFVIDLVNLLSHCIAQNNCLFEDDILQLLRLSTELWCRQNDHQNYSERKVNMIHHILRQDLRIRPSVFSLQMMDELIRYLNSCLQLLREERMIGLALRLTLNYFAKALTKYCSSESGFNSEYINRTGKFMYYSKVIRLIFRATTAAVGAKSLYHTLREDLYTLLCVPLSIKSPKDVAQSIAFVFEEQLRQIKSLSLRQEILEFIPSVLLKQKVIDVHLEKEFVIHPALAALSNTQTLQGAEFSLNKFCCVHLCRLPYQHDGTLHDLSYLLCLLSALLENHLLLITDIHPHSMFGPAATQKPQRNVPEDFLSVLKSIKPHIAGLVDRLSEDEVLLTQLVSARCWADIQRLSSITETVITSLAF